MSFRLNIKYYLVHSLGFTNKEAINAIESRLLKVNGEVVNANIEFNELWDIYLNDELLKPKAHFTYIALYKPRGIETTNNPNIPDNLTTVFKSESHLGYAGRLDKESEGLLILSNDGKYIQRLSSPNYLKEKEYLVTVNQPINEAFLSAMSNGLDIGICVTKPCIVTKEDDYLFKIILTEGKNKQIRRMCKKLGFGVKQLVRTRIDNVCIEGLKPSEFRRIQPI